LGTFLIVNSIEKYLSIINNIALFFMNHNPIDGIKIFFIKYN